jgi:hypothetical protein
MTPFVLYYVWRYYGYELFAIALLVDGYYQAFYYWPFFSLSLATLLVTFNFLKPKMLLYTE